MAPPPSRLGSHPQQKKLGHACFCQKYFAKYGFVFGPRHSKLNITIHFSIRQPPHWADSKTRPCRAPVPARARHWAKDVDGLQGQNRKMTARRRNTASHSVSRPPPPLPAAINNSYALLWTAICRTILDTPSRQELRVTTSNLYDQASIGQTSVTLPKHRCPEALGYLEDP